MAKGINATDMKRRSSLCNTIFPMDTAPHIFLFFFALALQLVASAVAGVGFALNGNGFWLAGFVLWLLWFVAMLIIVNPRIDIFLRRYRDGIRRAAFTIFIVLTILGVLELVIALFVMPIVLRNDTQGEFAQLLGQMQHGFQYNDGTALQQQATENLLNGKNPYAHANIITALVKYNGSFDRVTPLRAGQLSDVFPYPTEDQLKMIWDKAITNPSPAPPEIESRVCYPAGFFLLPAPFLAAGITDIRIVYILFILAGLFYAVWQIPGGKRWLFIAFSVVSLELWNSLADGETGSLIFPLLLVAWVSLGKNRWLSAIAMGLAVATKQTAWFFLPFYLILLWRKSNIKSLAFTIGVVGAIFVITNAYYIAIDPKLWFTSILSPMVDPMFPFGVGIVVMVTIGALNIHSALPFTVLEALVFIIGAVWYIRKSKRYPYAGPILSVLPLFFAWRSLWSYFFYIQLVIITCMLSATGNNSTSEMGGISNDLAEVSANMP